MTDNIAQIRDQWREIMDNDPDSRVGKAVARALESQCITDGERYFYDKIIAWMSSVRQAIHYFDPTCSPELPPFMMDPTFISKAFSIPIEKLTFQGRVIDPGIIGSLKEITARLETTPGEPADKGVFNEMEQDILEALGDKML